MHGSDNGLTSGANPIKLFILKTSKWVPNSLVVYYFKLDDSNITFEVRHCQEI